ncbi:MAG: amidohydrolase [Lachnospiraceae bacterium]|nr:amidohydrolase [Lachnospiraceae bacterium]
MNCIKIDAHVHLWAKQQGIVGGRPVYSVGNGKADFGGEIRQMMPPYMDDNRNSAERLIANMDYARVNGAVITQEYIDGNQDMYLLLSKEKYRDRLRICSLYEEHDDFRVDDFDGIKICAGRLKNQDLRAHMEVFKKAERFGKFVSIDMADGDAQVESMQAVIDECPDLRVAIGHFGMVTTEGWERQIALAKNKNVYIESGGLTWLFHKEFYPYPSAVDAILTARDICGMDKLMWGSDYPRTMTDITYIMAVRFIEETDKLTEAEKQAFLGGNAMRFYGFDFKEPMPFIDNML